MYLTYYWLLLVSTGFQQLSGFGVSAQISSGVTRQLSTRVPELRGLLGIPPGLIAIATGVSFSYLERETKLLTCH